MSAPLTGIGSRRTPGVPIEITYAPFDGLPLDTARVVIIGREDAGATGTKAVETPTVITNFIDKAAAFAEAGGYFGVSSELALAVFAFLDTIEGGAFFPRITCVSVAYNADVTLADITDALAAIENIPADFIVIPQPWEDATSMALLKSHVIAQSAASRSDDQMFGTIGVTGSLEPDTATAVAASTYDSRNLVLGLLRHTTPTGLTTPAALASMLCARIAANPLPFNPINKQSVPIAAPTAESDWIDQGFNGTAETLLAAGITPFSTDRDGNVRIIRSVTSAKTQNETTGGPAIQTYFDVQDIQVLHFYRRALWTRLNQTDFVNAKFTDQKAAEVRSAAIHMASLFEDKGMFQRVRELAPFFQFERNLSDRTRMDFKIPVNVVPGLHSLAGNIEAGVRFDVLSV